MARATALIDTGATSSGLTHGPVAELGLRALSKRLVFSAGGSQVVDTFAFRLGFFGPDVRNEDLPYLLPPLIGPVFAPT